MNALVKIDHTPNLQEGRDLIVKAGDLLAAQLISGLTKLEADAADSEAVLKRVPVVDEKTLERTADFLKAVTEVHAAGDETRKRIKAPALDLTRLIDDVFRDGLKRLSDVKAAVQAKLDAYYAKLEADRDAAAKAAATGSPVTAEAAQALLAPVKATSDFGTSVSPTTKVSGELTSIRVFLVWASQALTDEEIAKIDVPKSLLNKLAKDGAELGALGTQDPNYIGAVEFEANTGIKIKTEKKANVR